MPIRTAPRRASPAAARIPYRVPNQPWSEQPSSKEVGMSVPLQESQILGLPGDLPRVVSDGSNLPLSPPVLERTTSEIFTVQSPTPHIGALCPGFDAPVELYLDDDGVYRPPRATVKAVPNLSTVWEEQSIGPRPRSSKTMEELEVPREAVLLPSRHEFSNSRRLAGSQHSHHDHTPSPDPDPIYSDLGQESEDPRVDEEIRSCARALIGINTSIRRLFRSARAMIDLVGIEPNPGPPKTHKKSKAEQKVKKVTEVVKVKRPVAPASHRVGRYLSGEVWNPRADMAAYMMTLCDAEKHPPVRLGGETMIQTALTQLHGSFSFPVAASTSIVIHPRIWQPVLTSTSATPGSYTYVAQNIFTANSVTQLQGLAAGARVVSCKVKVYTLASATADSGLLVAGLSPRDDGFLNGQETTFYPTGGASAAFLNSVSSGGFPILATAQQTGTAAGMATQGFNEFQSYDFVENVPLKDGVSIHWLPEDPQTMTFVSDRVRQSSLAVVTNAGATAGTFANSSAIVDPFFVVGVVGATNASTVVVEMYLNLEYVVTSGAAGIIDTSAGSMNSIQAMEVVRKIGGNLQNTVEPNPEASLGDRLFSAGKHLIKGGVRQVSKFLFGSSDIGDSVLDLFGG